MPLPSGPPPTRGQRLLPYVFLAAANLMWAGNQVMGRGLRESFGSMNKSFNPGAAAGAGVRNGPPPRAPHCRWSSRRNGP